MSKTKAYEPAAPCVTHVDSCGRHVDKDDRNILSYRKEFPGLTKRELFAKDFMAALLSNPEYDVLDGNVAQDACSMANALIKKLNETEG